MGPVLADIAHMSRNIRRAPASAVTAILSLSLTLGAAAVIFAIVDRVLLTPPPFSDPDRLIVIREVPLADATAAPRPVAYATFDAWRDRAGAIASLEGFDGTNATLTDLGTAERVSMTDVTPGFLTLLGVSPAQGRAFQPDDLGQRVLIVSDAFWRGKLASDPNVIGRHIVLGGQTHVIVGVLPKEFFWALNPCDFWRPFPRTAEGAARAGEHVAVVARLSRATAPEPFAATLDDVSFRSSPPSRALATPIRTAITGDARKTLAILAGAAALAIVLAFTNLAGLLIVRSIDRRRELAVRSALGASRAEIAWQLLLEAEMLVAAGVVGGMVLAYWTTPLFGRLTLQQFGGVTRQDIAVTWRVASVVGMLAFVSAAFCGSLPAFGALRWNITEILRRGATPQRHEIRVRRLFVAGQIMLAFALLVSVTLLGRSLYAATKVDPGFEPADVLTLGISLPGSAYPRREQVVAFYSALQDALQARLGAGSAAIVDELPLTGEHGRTLVTAGSSGLGRDAFVRTAGPGYFDVMRVPVVAGRPFDSTDNLAVSPRVLVSGELARKLFGDQRAVGREITVKGTAQQIEIIGVVGDLKQRALDERDSPTVYFSALQAPSNSNRIVVRSRQPAAAVVELVQQEVARLDAHVPVYAVRSMADILAASPGMPIRRVLTLTFTGFATLALVLSCVGLFGVVAHDVACRRAELALRVALGATPSQILRGILAQGLLMIGFGLVAGVVLSIWTAGWLGGMLAGTKLGMFNVGVPAALLGIAGILAILPGARRAASTDPVIVLRSS